MFDTSNQITLLYYRTLREMNNPRAVKILRHNGSHSYFTYHLAPRDYS